MTTLREVEIRCRGATNLLEAWRADHERVREIWNLEDLTTLFLDCHTVCRAAHSHYIEHGEFPSEKFTYGYFLNVLRIYNFAASLISELASIQEAAGYTIDDIGELRASIEYVEQIITENQDDDLQQALDRIDDSTAERMMSPEEARDTRRALERPVSTIKVQMLPICGS